MDEGAGETPKKFRQLLFPWAEEERGELLKRLEGMQKELDLKKSRSDKWSAALLLGGIGMIMWTMCKWSEYMERKGKMYEAEWKLKYTPKGEPRPEYWSGRTLAEQAAEPSWVEYIQRQGGQIKQDRAK